MKMRCASILPLLAALVTYVACDPAKSSSHKESSSSEAKLSTLTLPIPHFADPFTKTIKGCHDDPALVIIGYPSGALEAGTTTAFLPPQASALSTTYVNKDLNRASISSLVSKFLREKNKLSSPNVFSEESLQISDNPC